MEEIQEYIDNQLNSKITKPKSKIWKYFDNEDNEGIPTVRCHFCQQKFSSCMAKNATKLRLHLELKCKDLPDDVRKELEDEFGKRQPPTPKKKQKLIIVQSVISNNNSSSNQENKRKIIYPRKFSPEPQAKKQKLRPSVSLSVKNLEYENQSLKKKLKFENHRNQMLNVLNDNLDECITLMKKIEEIKSNNIEDESENINQQERNLDECKEQLEIVEENIKKYRDIVNKIGIKYDGGDIEFDRIFDQDFDDDFGGGDIDDDDDDDDDYTPSHDYRSNSLKTHKGKGFSSIWKYFKKLNTNSSETKPYKCTFCGQVYNFKVPNAKKLRDHIVYRCTSVPDDVKELEDVGTETKTHCKVQIWEHFNVTSNENDEKVVCECKYCGIAYSGKNATKCRLHLIQKCEGITDDIKELIISQCDLGFLRSLESKEVKPKPKVWDHFEEFEDENDNRTCYKCKYCGHVFQYKNVTKFREHLVSKCLITPNTVKSEFEIDSAGRTWNQNRVPIWGHFIIHENENGQCERVVCKYCAHVYATKNATKCRSHLLWRCIVIPAEVREEIFKGSGEVIEVAPTISSVLKEDKNTDNNSIRRVYGGRKRCVIWNYYDVENDENGALKRKCKYCGVVFSGNTAINATKLRNHIVIKCKEAPDDIKKSIDEMDGFVRVANGIKTKRESGIKKFKCAWPGCDFACEKPSRLKKHLVVHTGFLGERLKCDWPGCEWTGREKFSLKVHRYIHTGEKPYECDWPGCDFKSAKPSSLYVHKLRHCNVKRFKCEWPGCDREFLTSSQRKVHKNVHLGLKPFACQFCDKCFPQSNKLKLHQNKHHQHLLQQH